MAIRNDRLVRGCIERSTKLRPAGPALGPCLSRRDHPPDNLQVIPQTNKDRVLRKRHPSGKRPGIDLDLSVVQDMLPGIIVRQEEKELFQKPVASQVACLYRTLLPFPFNDEIAVFDQLGVVLNY